MAQNLPAGLLVAGVFGQSRTHEYIFGGVTRILLLNCPHPLLLVPSSYLNVLGSRGFALLGG